MYWHGPTCLKGPVSRGRRRWQTPDPERTPRREQIRVELVERVRREIAAGVYETPEKWQAALERLAERLL